MPHRRRFGKRAAAGCSHKPESRNDADLRKLAGGNVLRALRQAEVVARRLQASRPASTASIEQLDGPAAR